MSQGKQKTRLNDNIKVPNVRVIDDKGEQLGILSIAEAISVAKAASLDLVEVSPNANPPVCRVMDYGKYQFESGKRKNAGKKKQKQSQVKELKFGVRIEEADYQVKLRNLLRFLSGGDKVKISLRFKGREMAHKELGIKLFERICEDMADDAVVEQAAKLDGRQVIMVLAPQAKTKA